MNWEQEQLLERLKMSMPMESLHGLSDLNQVRWEVLIKLLESILK